MLEDHILCRLELLSCNKMLKEGTIILNIHQLFLDDFGWSSNRRETGSRRTLGVTFLYLIDLEF